MAESLIRVKYVRNGDQVVMNGTYYNLADIQEAIYQSWELTPGLGGGEISKYLSSLRDFLGSLKDDGEPHTLWEVSTETWLPIAEDVVSY